MRKFKVGFGCLKSQANTDNAELNGIDASLVEELQSCVSSVVGKPALEINRPGGFGRPVFQVGFDDATYVFSKRSTLDAARKEAAVLRALGYTGHVPRLKAQADRWIIQEHCPGERLSVLLDGAQQMPERENAVSTAIKGLLETADATRSAGLDAWLPVIGAEPGWHVKRLSAANRLSQTLSIPAPDVDLDVLVDAMSGPRDSFIKFDARPGNALIQGPSCVWVDWEDCGFGRALEDLAFLICDEWMPLDGAGEERLISQWLPHFKGADSIDNARRALTIYGVTHMLIRLHMAFTHRLQSGAWWDRAECLSSDLTGNTAEEMRRLCDRIIRWSEPVAELRPYRAWVNIIIDIVESSANHSTLVDRNAA